MTATTAGVTGRAVLTVVAPAPTVVAVTPDTLALPALGQTATAGRRGARPDRAGDGRRPGVLVECRPGGRGGRLGGASHGRRQRRGDDHRQGGGGLGRRVGDGDAVGRFGRRLAICRHGRAWRHAAAGGGGVRRQRPSDRKRGVCVVVERRFRGNSGRDRSGAWRRGGRGHDYRHLGFGGGVVRDHRREPGQGGAGGAVRGGGRPQLDETRRLAERPRRWASGTASRPTAWAGSFRWTLGRTSWPAGSHIRSAISLRWSASSWRTIS